MDAKQYDEKKNVIYKFKNGNGFLQDYENDNLIFEDEYLNGERNEIWKEYNDIYEYLEFEGEYLNDKRNGKEKEYSLQITLQHHENLYIKIKNFHRFFELKRILIIFE